MDLFADLEKDLADFGALVTKSKAAPPPPEETRLKAALAEEENQRVELQKALGDANIKISEQDAKLKRLVEGIKEEREMQQKEYDQVMDRAESAEDRAEMLETKLMKLIDFVRNNPPASSTVEAEVQQLRERAQQSEDLAIERSKQMGSLEGIVSDLQRQVMEGDEERQSLWTELGNERMTRMELEAKLHQLSDISIERDSLHAKVRQLEKENIILSSQLSETRSDLEIQLKTREKSTDTRTITVDDEYKAKMTKFLQMIQMERQETDEKIRDGEVEIQKLKTQIEAMQNSHNQMIQTLREQHIQEDTQKAERENSNMSVALQQKISRNEELERKVQKLETNLALYQTGRKVTPTSSFDLTNSLDRKKAQLTPTPSFELTSSLDAPASAVELTNEIKKGLQLKKPSPLKTELLQPVPDTASIAAMATDIVKDREMRSLYLRKQSLGSVKRSNRLSIVLSELKGGIVDPAPTPSSPTKTEETTS
ncbi:hypothetical protein PROFUN_15305 [Planoprotostelium fungivorum]|uniref:Uncharacterized protein n=1 Tax=Planoprotostelium fungivorum TaxID=1890364 RepID=A0A2P6MX04_9EUKA|nr:hypothetical protein PROFUN_15305 [Planoprotostelium fungivorum]